MDSGAVRVAIPAAVRSERIIAIFRGVGTNAVTARVPLLAAAGINVIEVTLDSPEALETIAEIRRSKPRATVGAGTVMSAMSAEAAIEAGATFIASPVADTGVIDTARHAGVATMPGALTPGEIHAAWTMGASAVKVFPAGSFGASYLRSVLAPLRDVSVVATGGVTAENAVEFLNAGASAVGVGGWLTSGDEHLVTRRSAELVEATAGAARSHTRG
jgi:2-dehydro-3-deoxyphosphogluconate aldolase/(4S)-4-hydroxy-2-oxoglutarate aldolase